MYCKKCGSEIPKKADFCPKCGTAVPQNKHFRKTILIVSACAVIIGVLSIVFIKQTLNNNRTSFDENNIGEVYYAEIDPAHVAKTDAGGLYADNELLVVASSKASYNDIEKIAAEYNGEIVGWIEQTGDYQIKFTNAYSISELNQISDNMTNNKLVLSSTPNFIAEYSNDDFCGFEFGKEWEEDLGTFDYLGKSWGWEIIRTFDAWWYMDKLKENGGEINPIRVGVIDDGFDFNHEDLGFALTNMGVYTNTTKNHGTHVAGTMAAKANNTKGICGVYPYGDGNLYGVSWKDAGSMQENTSCMQEKCLLSELILRNVKVINCSYGYKLVDVYIDYWNGSVFVK